MNRVAAEVTRLHLGQLRVEGCVAECFRSSSPTRTRSSCYALLQARPKGVRRQDIRDEDAKAFATPTALATIGTPNPLDSQTAAPNAMRIVAVELCYGDPAFPMKKHFLRRHCDRGRGAGCPGRPPHRSRRAVFPHRALHHHSLTHGWPDSGDQAGSLPQPAMGSIQVCSTVQNWLCCG